MEGSGTNYINVLVTGLDKVAVAQVPITILVAGLGKVAVAVRWSL